MHDLTNMFRRQSTFAIVFLILGSWLLAGIQQGVAQEAATPAPGMPAPSPVDLAAVPVPAGEFPEPGYQLAQAGDIELDGFQTAWAGDGLDEAEWQPIAGHYEHGHAAVQVLLSDRADPRSEPLAHVLTTIVGLDSAGAADTAMGAFLGILDIEDAEDVDGATVYSDVDGYLGLAVQGDYLILVQYSFPEQQFSTRQNTEDWTPDSIADLVTATGERLQDAVDAATEGAESLGVANVMVVGPDAGWTISWPYFPNTEHYRVLDGDVVPYGGELDPDAREMTPPGVQDLFVSRQQVGQEGYEHLIDVTLARFDSEEAAADFAAAPAPVSFPPTWRFDVDVSNSLELDGGVRRERARTDGDELRASGYRTVRQDGDSVQVVQWLGSGNALVTEEAITWLTDLQSSCLDALPEPCAPVSQDDLPVAIDERGLQGDATEQDATPVSGLSEGGVLASPQFGWHVQLPDDGWSITNTELFGDTDFFRLQSGRSFITIESAVDRHGDPQRCVLDNLALLEEFEDRAVIDLGSDDPDERVAGIEQDHGWAIYTVEPLQEERAGQEYTIRIDCYTLVPGDASLVVTHMAPRDLWTAEREKGDRFRDGIRLPEPSAIAHVTLPEGDGQAMGRTQAMGIPRIWIPLAA